MQICPQGAAWRPGLLYVDGELERALAPGFHAFFAVERGVTVKIFDTRVSRFNSCRPYHFPTDVSAGSKADSLRVGERRTQPSGVISGMSLRPFCR